jgi:hypothetical protein
MTPKSPRAKTGKKITIFPTINGTGTEDYFNRAYDFEVNGRYQEFSSPYSGLSQVIRPDGLCQSQERFGLYRWHIVDPIRADHDLRVTIQDLGWQSGRRYLPLTGDIASTAFSYQSEPHAAFPKLPSADETAAELIVLICAPSAATSEFLVC